MIGVVFGADVGGSGEGADLDGPLVEHGQRVRQPAVEVVLALARIKGGLTVRGSTGYRL